jgi:hypothetical protein
LGKLNWDKLKHTGKRQIAARDEESDMGARWLNSRRKSAKGKMKSYRIVPEERWRHMNSTRKETKRLCDQYDPVRLSQSQLNWLTGLEKQSAAQKETAQ